ncbi:efflux RND transporter periplasmic adaptor subunit [Chitinophaga oryzae]|uniref:Efflux RND transporter periplasmic adaptor subunit n=1 Tax=Chitinophaga oryzae TaxID=2725414 RepID=A0ABX6LBS5_9BACT|nr:efflux RND transporter periplasmic adaptor subunit [Chitinophaga oryzae]QJB37249.1 efflux RND transporter periplasmic adaptor subunit [Chitinophaga oryzae]
MAAACNPAGQETDKRQRSPFVGLDTSLQHDSINGAYWNTLPANRTVIARQQVVAPVFITVDFAISGNGYVTFDVRRSRKVPIRVAGRIERLYIRYNYQYVHKGEKMLELYSPELNTYIDEYVYLLRQTSDTILQNSARKRLLLLGLTPGQVREVEQSGGVSSTIPVYSPFEGYVLFSPSPAQGMDNTGNSSGGMNNSFDDKNSMPLSARGTVLPDNSIREGMYLSKDQTLFWVNDFREVWGIIGFTQENEKYIRKGQDVTVTSEIFPERPVRTSIQLVEQVYQDRQKFTQARVYIPNPAGVLKQNSLITATVRVPVKSLVIPASSVYYLGKVAIAWVQIAVTGEGNGIFQSRVIRVGHRNGDVVEILDGLSQQEKIAKDAGYLADGEAIIQY